MSSPLLSTDGYKTPSSSASLRRDAMKLSRACLLDHQLLGARVAVVKLMELMESSNEQVSLRAAIALQSAGLQAYQLIDVRKRVQRIEDNLGMFFSWRN